MNKENNTQEQVTPTGELDGQQAINVLVQAVRIAQSKGAYTIEDAGMISKAIKFFTPPTPPVEEIKEELNILDEEN